MTNEALPERGLFYRADHFSLAKHGVPTLLFMAISGAPYLKVGGRAAGEAWLDAYMKCYHQTCDAWSPTCALPPRANFGLTYPNVARSRRLTAGSYRAHNRISPAPAHSLQIATVLCALASAAPDRGEWKFYGGSSAYDGLFAPNPCDSGIAYRSPDA